jgi:trehalose-6-phosphate synthase
MANALAYTCSSVWCVQAAAALKATHGERIIIGGLDVCQKLSGVTLKLLAFERLLTEYPVWRGKVTHNTPLYHCATFDIIIAEHSEHAMLS